jgi:hypothetical protein
MSSPCKQEISVSSTVDVVDSLHDIERDLDGHHFSKAESLKRQRCKWDLRGQDDTERGKGRSYDTAGHGVEIP